MNYIIFGGSGFIGTHLINFINLYYRKDVDKVYVLDLVMPGEKGIASFVVEKIDRVDYIRCDIREPIKVDLDIKLGDIIFNLAAVHRTPGHPDYEYFETNIRGAENVCAFADKYGIKRMLFTSSIAPYGAAENLKKEVTLPTPNTPYGISKLVAEKIHQVWQSGDKERSLIILRPGVVFGKGENGNFTRLYWGIRKHEFFYPGRKDTIKACIYVKELVNFALYRMTNDAPGTCEIFNCTFEPAFNIEQIVETMKEVTGLKRHIFKINGTFLKAVAAIAAPIGGKRLGIHPDRVKKLMISTNISGVKLADTDYKFRYSFEEAIGDWFADNNNQCLK